MSQVDLDWIEANDNFIADGPTLVHQVSSKAVTRKTLVNHTKNAFHHGRIV